jgi:hypothetical protein
MKVSELMIGDWVSYNGHPVLVEALNKSDGYVIEKDMISIKLTDNTCIGINAERLEPLLLTKEIMEQNGYESEIDEKEDDAIYELKRHVCISLNDGIIYTTYKNDIGFLEYIFLCTCKYAHQLQHILKDLQIEKEITL